MTVTEGIGIFLVVIAIILAAFWFGWDQAVNRWRQKDHNRGLFIQDLDNQIAYFNKQKDEDPQRAWVDVGIIHALNTIESASEELRNDVNKRRENLS